MGSSLDVFLFIPLDSLLPCRCFEASYSVYLCWPLAGCMTLDEYQWHADMQLSEEEGAVVLT